MSEIAWVLKVVWHYAFLEPFRSAVPKSRKVAILGAGWGYALLIGGYFVILVPILFIGAFTGLNDYVYPDTASYEISMTPTWVGPITERSKEYESRNLQYFTSGHRCARRPVRVEFPKQGVCASPNGIPVQVKPPDGWAITCCPSVVTDSDRERSASLRRWLAEDGKEHTLRRLMVASIPHVSAALLVFVALEVLAIFKLLPGLGIIAIVRIFGSITRGLRNAFLIALTPRLKIIPIDTELSGLPVLCQLTDLHLTTDDEVPEELKSRDSFWRSSGVPPNGAELRYRTQVALQFAQAMSPLALLITGDITDSGAEAEWENWHKAYRSSGIASGKTPLYILPGNHDLTFNLPAIPDVKLAYVKVRRDRFECAIATLKDQNPDVAVGVTDYPKLLPLPHSAVHIFFLDSNNYRSHHGLSGALGKIGRKQISTVSKKLEELEGPLIVALHHHVGINRREHLALPEVVQDKTMLATDARLLLKVLRRYAHQNTSLNRVLIIHGHRHRTLYALDEKYCIKVFGLCSSTMGHEARVERRSFIDGVSRIASVHLKADGNWSVNVHDVPNTAICRANA